MNALQRRCLTRRYVQMARKELEGLHFDTDMVIDNNDWVYCRFVSEKQNVIYILRVVTAKYEFYSNLFDAAYDNILKNGDHSQEQSSDYITKAKDEMCRILDADDADFVVEKFIEADVPNSIGRKMIDATINVPYINKRDIIKTY